MQDRTEIIVLLDRSGSMDSIRHAVEQGFDALIEEHKATPSTRVTLVQFDHLGTYSQLVENQRLAPGTQIETVYTARPVTDVPKLTLIPRGGTPLLDAICTTIDQTGDRFAATPEAERPKAVLFVIITDGQENMSTRYSRTDALRRIEHQTGTYRWQFSYIGANQDAIAEARSFGIQAQRAITFNANPIATANVLSTYAKKSASFVRGMSLGSTVEECSATMDWNAAERKEAEATS